MLKKQILNLYQLSRKKLLKKKKFLLKKIAKKIDKNIEPHALNDEITEKVRELIHLSREQGFLTYKDIDKSLPEIANDPEELQNVISIFNNLEIKLLDSNEVEKFKKKKRKARKKQLGQIRVICLTTLYECISSKWDKFLFFREKKKSTFPKGSKPLKVLH